MTSSRPLRALAPAALILSLLVGGCRGGPPPTPAEPAQATTGERSAAAGEPSAAATAPPGDPPAAEPTTSATPVLARPFTREQSLRLPITEPPTLDPGLATDSTSIDVVTQLFEGLIAFDDGAEPIGLGAEQVTVSDDGLTYTFTLREEPRWSDGKPVTAQDYEWAWKRNVDPRTASDYATRFYPIKNAARIHRENLDPRELGVVAVGDRTLVVTLEQPAAYFLRLVASWTMVPLRRDVIEQFGDRWTEAKNIVTNGPFAMKAWQHDGQIVLERRDDYWAERPLLARVTYRIFPEGASDQVLAAYEAGELDLMGSGTAFEIPAAQGDRLAADPRLRSEVRTFDQAATMFITVNNRRPHLKDARVRMALGQALERQHLLEQVLRRVGTPAAGLHPEGVAGRRPRAWPEEDLAEARRNLAEAGFPEGRGFPEITFAYNSNPQWKLLGEYLQQRYKAALGINVKLDAMEWAVFLRWRRGEDWQNTGDLYRGGWFSDYEDPNDWYNALWDSREDPGVFSSGWKNEEYDRLVRQAQAELDQRRREALYGQAEQILASEYPNIPVFHYGLRTLVKPYVENFRPQRVLGITPLKRVRLADRP